MRLSYIYVGNSYSGKIAIYIETTQIYLILIHYRQGISGCMLPTPQPQPHSSPIPHPPPPTPTPTPQSGGYMWNKP